MATPSTDSRAAPRDAAGAAMERYAAGDATAFGELYDLLLPRLYPYLLRRTRDAALAEDLLQQTLLNVHRARSSFIPGADVWAWVFAIARRLAIDSVRVASRERRLAGDAEMLADDGGAAGAEAVVGAKELAVRFEGELAALPESQRVAYSLVKRRGLSLAAAAEALAITIGALKVRVHRAERALRTALEASDKEA
jgi:RNA polymerase sigma-70 factor, ECF subfamily